MPKNYSIRCLVFIALTLIISAGQLFAQGDGSITGVVTDANGAVIPNATVKLVSIARGSELTTAASSDGIYTFTSLVPGKYSVTASGGSFAEQKLEVEVQVGRKTDANFTLGAQAVGAQVTVTAEGVQTTQSNADAVLSETAISNLPINGRRFQDFATLTPTAQIDTERNQISLSGQRGINANINVDGVDYNQPFFGGIRGGERSNFAPTIPQESIKEFQVVAAGYSAEYGRSSGGIVNVVTKGGTNDFRGSAFALFRPSGTSRNHALVRAIEVERSLNIVAAPTQKQFGGSFGGPIAKNKLFFFGSYEQQKFRADRFVLFGLANITRGTTNQEGYDYFRSQEATYQLTNDAKTALGRVDWNVNGSNMVNFRYSWNDGIGLNSVAVGDAGVLFNPVVDTALSNEGTEKDRNNVAVSQWTSTFGSNAVNDFRFQWAKGLRPRFANAMTPTVTVSNVGLYGTRSFLPTTQSDRRIQFAEGFSLIKGNHTMKFGGEFSDIFADQVFGFNQFGSYSMSAGDTGLQQLSLTPGSTTDRRFDTSSNFYTQAIGNLLADFTVREFAIYGQDAWRVTPRLTVNFGLRVEKQYNPSAQTGNDAIINAVKAVSLPALAGATFDPTIIPDSPWQFGPRFGFAWDVNGNGKSVFRGFAGQYFARTPGLILAGPVNNFRIPPGDVTVQLPFTTSQLSAATAAGVTAYNAFLTANPQYITIMTATGTPCPLVVNPSDTRACVPNTVYRQFATLNINLNGSGLGSLPTLTPTQMSSIATALGAPTVVPAQGANLFAMSKDYENPKAFQFGFGYEREIADNFIVGIDFSQVKTTHLQRNRDVNLPAPISGSAYADLLIGANSATVLAGAQFQQMIADLRASNRQTFAVVVPSGLPTCAVNVNPCPAGNTITRPTRARPISLVNRLILREDSARSLFRAFTLRTRVVRKWGNINAYYTVSKSLSDDDNERSATTIYYENAFDMGPEYGYARLDRKHQFVANPIFFLPYGFEVSAAIRLRSGVPLDAVVGADVNGDTVNADRPLVIPGLAMERNFFRNRNEYGVDVRGQKGFTFNETRRLIFSAEIFNLFNNANIQFGGNQTNFCTVRDVRCGLDGPTNPTFLQIRNAAGTLITPTGGNTSRTPVFSMQFGIRLQL